MKLLLIFLLLNLNLFSKTMEFEGLFKNNLITEEWKKKNKERLGNIGGCIFHGKTLQGEFVKVYTAHSCPPKNNKKAIIACQIFSTKLVPDLQKNFMYEGECIVK